MPSGKLLVETDGPIRLITVNRPDVRNALDSATIDALREAILDVRHEPSARCAIITGSGDRAFVAGADISQLSRLTAIDGKEYSSRGQHVLDLIENCGKPVIAAINGKALGGGCELALACHLRIAADTAALGQPEVKLGLIPGFGGTQRLPRLVGKGSALELLLTGRDVPAEEALRIGLVHKVVPAAELLDSARAWARELAAMAPLAVQAIMESVNRGLEMALPEANFLESVLFGMAAGSDDGHEGTRAFLEKRRAEFKGR